MRRPWARFARYGSIYCGEVRRSLRGESPIFDLQTDSEHPTAMAIFTVNRDFGFDANMAIFFRKNTPPTHIAHSAALLYVTRTRPYDFAVFLHTAPLKLGLAPSMSVKKLLVSTLVLVKVLVRTMAHM